MSKIEGKHIEDLDEEIKEIMIGLLYVNDKLGEQDLCERTQKIVKIRYGIDLPID